MTEEELYYHLDAVVAHEEQEPLKHDLKRPKGVHEGLRIPHALAKCGINVIAEDARQSSDHGKPREYAAEKKRYEIDKKNYYH